MASIIKLPTESKGIISFTSPEMRELIEKSNDTKNFLIEQRKNWIYLLHHNWQPCHHNEFFDSSLCNYVDLIGNGNCLDLDCCNFSPTIFYPSENKTFDILYVTRAVTFKRLTKFFEVCKLLLNKKENIKILLICSVPEQDCDPKNPKQMYLDYFTREERKNFLALFFDYDYPFSVSKDYLAHFYRSSKVFLHTACDERHPRVCSYAWSSGIPVVGYKNLATFLPERFQQEPFFFEVKNDDEYVDKILKAIDTPMPYEDIKFYVNEDFSKKVLIEKLHNLFNQKGLFFEEKKFYLKNLDFRLGRHCKISLGDNSLPTTIENLMKSINDKSYKIDDSVEDFEIELLRNG